MTISLNLQRPTKGVIAILAAAFLFGFASQATAQCDPIQQAKLFPFDGLSGDRSGDSVSISGNIAVVGAWRNDENGENSGAAYMWKRVDGEWLEITKLVPSDPAVEARFRWSVSISGNFIIIGAPSDNGSPNQGAYVIDLNCPAIAAFSAGSP